MIEFVNISKSYTTKNQVNTVLKDINLKIEDGEILGIVGYSGAGKSTLVRLINRLIEPTSGHIVVDSKHIHQLKQEDLNRMRYDLSMVFQHFNLIANMSVYENIKIALHIKNYPKLKIEKRIDEVLSLVSLLDKKHSYPKMLSGGEKQRVGIARAIANEPKYLLCDEATSALDQKTASEIVNLLKTIQKETQITIIFISHQMEIIKDLCNRVIVMSEGAIVEDNDTKSIFVYPKTSVTKQLIKQVIDEPIDLKDGRLYELIYNHSNANHQLLSQVIKTYQIDVNIVHAKTLSIGDEKIGYLYLEISGDQKGSAIKHLKISQVEVRLYV